MLDFDVYDAIVRAMYEASMGALSWEIVLDQMCRAFNGWNAHLMGIEVATGTMLFSMEGGDPPPQGTLEYVRVWHRRDPRAALVLSHPPGRWFHCHEHFDDAYVARSEFYQDFLLPYGMRYISGVRFDLPEGVACVLSVSRAIGTQPFDDAERTVLRRLGEHFQNAFSLQRRVQQATRFAYAGYAVLEKLRYPVFVMDEQRMILFRNPAARSEPVIDFVRDVDGRLRLAVAADDASFTSVLKDALLRKQDAHDSVDSFMRLRGVNKADSAALLHLSVTRPEAEMRAFGPQPTVIATVFLPGVKHQIDPYVVGVAYGLTPAEARVASAVGEGKDIAQIAREQNRSVATVRTQLKSIFEKAAVHRQAELAQILAGNPAFWRGGLVS